MATQLREVATPAFKVYCQQVKANIAALAKALTAKGYRCVVLAARDSRVPNTHGLVSAVVAALLLVALRTT